jgi:hypothetical protein
MVFVYFSRNYTASASGSVVRAVWCERCGRDYFYSLFRFATGKATAAYGIGAGHAAKRAQNQAAKKLDRALQTSADPVPCPHCQWLQAPMVRFIRGQRLAWLQSLLWIVPLVFLVPLVLVYFLGGDTAWWREEVQPGLLMVILAVAGTAVCASVALAIYRRRYDPNERLRTQGARTNLPPAPPPLLRTPWPPHLVAAAQQQATQEASVAAHAPEPTAAVPTLDYFSGAQATAPSPEPIDVRTHTLLMPAPVAAGINEADGGWVTVQLVRTGWPRACVRCLGEPDTTFARAVPMKLREGPSLSLTVPLCEQCRRALRARWWKLAGITVVIGGVASAAGYFLLPPQDSTPTLFAVVASIITLVAAPIVAGTVGKPHRFAAVDARRGFYRLRFKNRGYTELVSRAWTSPEIHAVCVRNEYVAHLLESARPANAVVPVPSRATL